MLFKDEVRKIGNSLKMPQEILSRHPFPGPGLGIRILGEVDYESIGLIQEADKIYIDALKNGISTIKFGKLALYYYLLKVSV
ncbi:MAG: hypothetical protein CM15mP102_12060 [Flavobacteriales bacterium]|nr:MAG: hypothetical protein CM15mP102_12060 [Flavobacteriales bacterium]